MGVKAAAVKPDSSKGKSDPYEHDDVIGIFKAHNAYINSPFKKARENMQTMWEGIMELAKKDHNTDLSDR